MLIYLDQISPAGFYNNKETHLGRLYFFDQLPSRQTNNLNEYLADPDNFKIAILYNRFDGPTADKPDQFVLKNFELLQQSSSLVFLMQTELQSNSIVPYLKKNVYAVLPGFIDAVEYTIFRGVWFDAVSGLYQQFPEVLSQFDFASCPFFFDALLGTKTPVRDFIYQSILDNKLTNKIFLNYVGNGRDQYISEPGVELPNNLTHSSTHVTYKNVRVHFSNILPITIYKNSSYSIVAESRSTGKFNFYTEKTAKPIIARRLFVVFASRYHLKNLRSLGFQTFDNVIDESYDEIEDNQQRWAVAFEQVKYLCKQDQNMVLSAIKSRVDHNYQLFMSTDWTQIAVDQMLDIINTTTAATA